MAQWKRAGPITQRSVDRNHALLYFLKFYCCNVFDTLRSEWLCAKPGSINFFIMMIYLKVHNICTVYISTGAEWRSGSVEGP